MNKVILMGRITKDPELKYTQTTSISVTRFTIAVNKKVGTEKKADFFNIVAWKGTAEFITKYFKKGQQIAIVGNLSNREYEDSTGNKRQVTEVIADEVYFADSRK